MWKKWKLECYITTPTKTEKTSAVLREQSRGRNMLKIKNFSSSKDTTEIRKIALRILG